MNRGATAGGEAELPRAPVSRKLPSPVPGSRAAPHRADREAGHAHGMRRGSGAERAQHRAMHRAARPALSRLNAERRVKS